MPVLSSQLGLEDSTVGGLYQRYCPAPLGWFQSQMRSQFPRHLEAWICETDQHGVSISDEKPVPSPRHTTHEPPEQPASFNLR